MGTQKDVLNESEAKTAARKRCCWLLKGSPWCHHTHMGALDGLAKLSPYLSLLPYPISLKPLFSHTKYLQHHLEGGTQRSGQSSLQLHQRHPCHNHC